MRQPCGGAHISPAIRLALMDVQVLATSAARIYIHLCSIAQLVCSTPHFNCADKTNQYAISKISTLYFGVLICIKVHGFLFLKKLSRFEFNISASSSILARGPHHLPLTDLTCVPCEASKPCETVSASTR